MAFDSWDELPGEVFDGVREALASPASLVESLGGAHAAIGLTTLFAVVVLLLVELIGLSRQTPRQRSGPYGIILLGVVVTIGTGLLRQRLPGGEGVLLHHTLYLMWSGASIALALGVRRLNGPRDIR